MARKRKPVEIKKQNVIKKQASAAHVRSKDGVHHLVVLKDIRVVIVPDDESYFAQGLDIDYAAQGETVEQVKANFETGLSATIDKHIQMFGTPRGMFRVAPPEICQHLLLNSSAVFKFYRKVSAHEVHKAMSAYGQINYLVAAAAQENEAAC
jgi:hypothetical protein